MSERSFGLQAPPSLGVLGKKRYAMVIDLRRCIGCMACVLADKAEFEVPLGVWRTWVQYEEYGTYPNVRRQFLSRLCNHCDDPPCVKACPVQATYKHEDGFVLQRYERCIGCRTCMVACPYNARHILPAKRSNPNLPTKVVDKCTFCFHRVTQGLVPACAQTCIGRVRIFGDINDPKSEVRKLIDTNPTVVLKPEKGTKPQVYYILANRSGLEPAKVFKNLSAQQKEDLKDHQEHFENYVGR
ncbi:MAG: (4Fe-4S)-binding protein [Deltaproteobacteria bacterium GWC2_42_51]|nr:MAG: (4Fe-4S)-binding protein [Deltaproteobacteria bacterium GWA2_42_85]OGP31825.1 MAG: (4Fe-4S)-binding protein [Deltaproteobacteria bacterium GWC2_42_51]OGP38043.1 MAG: (4Fe-4S)-binding protein [Deltaproteobacteria bacterium GWD2_42_10]OGP47621.1 MAG: (4Fe-4S)-binding protein [Deltaproteobacteria bacterium GWF2_42_12]OGQ30327.1 MAG: (4Fe-4S)-binding protein [Deltaproteobacteria bacterium RIFCSPHIGHO2_02_FULL_42_44]OGQ35629.1 MAG: (4Fe-4S)-binding protein [Deltaproteobacteria bacterium RIF